MGQAFSFSRSRERVRNPRPGAAQVCRVDRLDPAFSYKDRMGSHIPCVAAVDQYCLAPFPVAAPDRIERDDDFGPAAIVLEAETTLGNCDHAPFNFGDASLRIARRSVCKAHRLHLLRIDPRLLHPDFRVETTLPTIEDGEDAHAIRR